MSSFALCSYHHTLTSRTSTTFVKKKAALTLLRLYRKHPSVVPADDWAERIVDMIEDRDPGVAMTAVTLVTTMAQDNLDAFQGCYKLVVDKLDKLIFDGDYPSEYVYYKVCPKLGGGMKLIDRSLILGFRSRSCDCCSTTLHQVSSIVHVQKRADQQTTHR